MALTKVTNRMSDGASVSVKDFGAKGDGSTDDTTAIQNAINYASTHNIERVDFPDGHYIYTTLRVYHDQLLNTGYQGSNLYAGDGVDNTFDYGWYIEKASDLTVTVYGTEQTLDTDYTVSGVGEADGGTVTFLSGSIPAAPPVVAAEDIKTFEGSSDGVNGERTDYTIKGGSRILPDGSNVTVFLDDTNKNGTAYVEQTLTTDYTVTGNEVIFNTAPSSGSYIKIEVEKVISITSPNRDGRMQFVGRGRLAISDLRNYDGTNSDRLYGSILESSGGDGIILDTEQEFNTTSDARNFVCKDITLLAKNTGNLLRAEKGVGLTFDHCAIRQRDLNGSGLLIRNCWFFTMNQTYHMGASLLSTSITVDVGDSPQSVFTYTFDDTGMTADNFDVRISGERVQPQDYTVDTGANTITLDTNNVAAATTGTVVVISQRSTGVGISSQFVGSTFGNFAGLWNIDNSLVDSWNDGIQWTGGTVTNFSIRNSAIQNCSQYNFFADRGVIRNAVLDNVYFENQKIQGVSFVKVGRKEYFTSGLNQTAYTYGFTSPNADGDIEVTKLGFTEETFTATGGSNEVFTYTFTSPSKTGFIIVREEGVILEPDTYTVDLTAKTVTIDSTTASDEIKISVEEEKALTLTTDYTVNRTTKVVTLVSAPNKGDTVTIGVPDNSGSGIVRSLKMTNCFFLAGGNGTLARLIQPCIDITRIEHISIDNHYTFRSVQPFMNIDASSNGQNNVAEVRNSVWSQDQDISSLDRFYLFTGLLPNVHNLVWPGLAEGVSNNITGKMRLFSPVPNNGFINEYTDVRGTKGLSKFSFGDTEQLTGVTSPYRIGGGFNPTKTYYDFEHQESGGLAVYLPSVGSLAGSDGRVIIIRNNENSRVSPYEYLNVYYSDATPPAGILVQLRPGDTAMFVFDGKGTRAGAEAGDFVCVAKWSDGDRLLEMEDNIRFNVDGDGIDFGVTAGGGSSATLLDDYEEGTFTPTITASTTNPTITYTTQNGHYTKIGNLVTAQIKIVVDTVSGGVGNTFISGLPYTSLSQSGVTQAGVVAFASAFGANNHPRSVEVQNNSSQLIPRIATSTDANGPLGGAVDASLLAATCTINCSITYITN